ncbi:MAG: NUDIX hydrolase [Actinomycetota bacterium]|nr:NUDIX hydrolase [Actinomycetota bacterium]
MEPRPAATVIVVRPAPSGIEALILTRGAGTTFAPGFRVFPGGIVDPEDADLARRLFGDPSESARACGLRELYEETGILLTAEGPVAHQPGLRLDGLEFRPLERRSMPEVAHWIAPEFLEVRFDARFFAVAAPPGLDPVIDGHEIEAAEWLTPAEVLEGTQTGASQLMWPTFITMQRLARCRTVEDALALRVPQVPRPEAPAQKAAP